MAKSYRVSILCRQLPSSHAEYSYHVEAGKLHVAVSRALAIFEREPYVKGRRLLGVEIAATCVSTLVSASPRSLAKELHQV
jgi:hypothetical protein